MMSVPSLLRRLKPVMCILLLMGGLLHGVHGWAQAISIPVYEQLQQAQEKIEAEEHDAALRLLDELLSSRRRRLNTYEQAQAWNLKGSAYFQREDYESAIEAFATAVSFDDLPAGFLQVSYRTLAQLSFVQEHLPEALDYTRRMMALTDPPDPAHRALLAQIYYRMDDYRQALAEIREAIAMERARGNVPPENWLLMLNAVYFSLNDYPGMVEALSALVTHYPSARYVLNLAAIYGQQEQTERQLLLMEPLYEQGQLVRESELVNLANLMIMHQVPYKGARVLQRGLDQGQIQPTQRNWELLAQAWQLAAEDNRAATALAEAATLDEDGNTSFRLAQSYIGLYRWSEAEAALEQALRKGDLRRPGDAQLLLGMVRFYQQDFRNARRAFRAAGEHEETTRLAEQWLVYLDQEVAKREELQAQ